MPFQFFILSFQLQYFYIHPPGHCLNIIIFTYLSFKKMNFVESSKTFSANLIAWNNFTSWQFQVKQFFQFLGYTNISISGSKSRRIVDIVECGRSNLLCQTSTAQTYQTGSSVSEKFKRKKSWLMNLVHIIGCAFKSSIHMCTYNFYHIEKYWKIS